MTAYKGNCKNCGCRFRFSDKSFYTESDIYGNITTYVKCPVCGMRLHESDYNISDDERSVKSKLKIEKIYKSRVKKIGQFDSDGKLVNTYESATELSRSLKIPLSTIYNACRGENRKMMGFYWKYL